MGCRFDARMHMKPLLSKLFDVPSSSSRVARRFSPRRNGDSRSGIARSMLSDVVMDPSNPMVPTYSTTLTKVLSNSGSGESKIFLHRKIKPRCKYVSEEINDQC